MKEIPMLFSTPMVQAILEGRKTMTRRTNGLDAINDNPNDWQFEWAEPMKNVWTFTQKSTVTEQTLQNRTFNQVQLKCQYGRPGDVLWVRETFRKYCMVDDHGYTQYDKEIIEFAADNPPMINEMDPDGGTMFKKDGTEKFISWRPSIHMPKPAARIWLQVEDVKVERLQGISEEDAKAEGIEKRPGSDASTRFDYRHYHWDHWYNVDAKVSFRTLWEKINGPDSWAANPWVFVIKFKVLSTTGKPTII